MVIISAFFYFFYFIYIFKYIFFVGFDKGKKRLVSGNLGIAPPYLVITTVVLFYIFYLYYINFEIKCKRTIVQVTVELYCTFGLPRTPIKLLYSSGVLFGHSESELRFVYFVWFDCHQRHLNVE